MQGDRESRVKIHKTLLLLLSVFLLFDEARAQNKPALSETDRIRLAEVFRLAAAVGNRIWKDWHQAPFAVLLVTAEDEFLVGHPSPSEDFALSGLDPLLKSNVYVRKKVFPTNFLATFRAVGGVSTIVVGQAENTQAKTSTPWVVALLHEHFHQLQDSWPGMDTDVATLNLSRGDTSGMWMLNYPFPYESADVARQAAVMSKLLGEALDSGKTDFAARLGAYLQARRQLQAILNPDDYKYLSFQLWKEGIARYTEYHAAKLAADSYSPSKEFRSLKDFSPFKDTADSLLETIKETLRTLPLANYKRIAFYSLGAGEGLLLDRANLNWRRRYFEDKFFLEKHFNRN